MNLLACGALARSQFGRVSFEARRLLRKSGRRNQRDSPLGVALAQTPKIQRIRTAFERIALNLLHVQVYRYI